MTSRADDLGLDAMSNSLWSPIKYARVARATVAKIIVPNNMAEAMVVVGATLDALATMLPNIYFR